MTNEIKKLVDWLTIRHIQDAPGLTTDMRNAEAIIDHLTATQGNAELVERKSINEGLPKGHLGSYVRSNADLAFQLRGDKPYIEEAIAAFNIPERFMDDYNAVITALDAEPERKLSYDDATRVSALIELKDFAEQSNETHAKIKVGFVDEIIAALSAATEVVKSNIATESDAQEIMGRNNALSVDLADALNRINKYQIANDRYIIKIDKLDTENILLRNELADNKAEQPANPSALADWLEGKAQTYKKSSPHNIYLLEAAQALRQHPDSILQVLRDGGVVFDDQGAKWSWNGNDMDLDLSKIGGVLNNQHDVNSSFIQDLMDDTLTLYTPPEPVLEDGWYWCMVNDVKKPVEYHKWWLEEAPAVVNPITNPDTNQPWKIDGPEGGA